MSKQKTGLKLVLAVLAGASVVVGATNALACGGEWMPYMDAGLEEGPQIDYRPHGVLQAEKSLEAGKFADAAASVIRMMPHIKQLEAKESGSVVARAQRVLAVAIARSGGALDVGDQVPAHIRDTWLGESADARRTNLEFAVKALEGINQLKGGDPAIETDLGTAMAKLDERKQDAGRLLEKLAAKDLIAGPEGYATLAALRQAGGDERGARAATKRCRAMSDSDTLCGHVSDPDAKS